MKKPLKLFIVLIITAVVVVIGFRIHPFELPYYIDQSDVKNNYWNVSNFSESVLAGRNPYFTHQMFYPHGLNLYSHAYLPIIGFINCLIQNPILSINLVILINLVALFWGTYKLSSEYLETESLKILSALISLFNGYILTKFGIHYNLILLALVPWALYYFHKGFDFHIFRIKNKSYFIAGVCCTLINIIIDYYPIIFIFLVLFIWLLYPLITKATQRYSLKNIAIGWVISLLVIHVVSRLLYISGFDKKGGIWETADIRQFIIPSEFGYFFRCSNHYPNSPATENFIYLGFALIIALIWAIFVTFKHKNTVGKSLLFYLVMVFFIVIPVIRMNGNNLLFTPGSISHYIPFIDQFRGPSRFIEVFYILSFIFIFQNIEFQFKNRSFSMLTAIPIIIAACFIVEQFTQKPSYNSDAKFKLTTIEQNIVSEKTILGFPFGIRDGMKEIGHFNTQDFQLIQNTNSKILSGYISRIPTSRWKLYESDSFIQSILHIQHNSDSSTLHDWKYFNEGLKSNHINLIRISLKEIQFPNRFTQNLTSNLTCSYTKKEVNQSLYIFINP